MPENEDNDAWAPNGRVPDLIIPSGRHVHCCMSYYHIQIIIGDQNMQAPLLAGNEGARSTAPSETS